MIKTKSDYQEEALRALAKNDFQGSIIMPTGLGKSRVLVEAAKSIVALGQFKPIKILYLCNSTMLRDSGFLAELVKWKGKHLLSMIEFECYQSAYKRHNHVYDLVLADEADFALSPEYIKFFSRNSIKKTIAVSATLNHLKEAMLESVAPIVYSVTLKEAEDTGTLNITKFYRVPFVMTKEETTKYDILTSRIAKYMSLDRDASLEFNLKKVILKRKQLLNTLESSKLACIRLLTQLETRGDLKILLFCEQVDHVKDITPHTFHGTTPKNSPVFDDFNEGRIRTLGVCDRLNRGINLKDVNCIVVESCGRSVTKITQRLGRGKRLAVEDVLRAFFLVPYRMTDSGKLKPTVAHEWLQEALKNNIKLTDMTAISV